MKFHTSQKVLLYLLCVPILAPVFTLLYSSIEFSNEEVFCKKKKIESPTKLLLKDRMDLAMKQEFDLTRDPAINDVPRERLIDAIQYATALRQAAGNNRIAGAIPGMNWVERGPKNVGGRTRAIMVDPNDVSGKSVWSAGVGGGLWKTNDIFVSSPVWTAANDMFDNIAITTLAYNPLNKQEMYFGTGEGYYNADAIRGNGIWKSTDGGATWQHLASTVNVTSFRYIQKIVVHPANGHVYAGASGGLFKSMDGGATWTKVLGSGTGASTDGIADVEIATDNNIYAAVGIFATDGIYKSSAGNAGTWTKLNIGGSGFATSGFNRIEIACAPSNALVIYAVTQSSTTYGVGQIYQSVNGGTSWSSRSNPVDADNGIGNDFTRGQAWYDLTMAVDPLNSTTVFIGGVDLFKSTNGCSSWQQISHWYGGFGFQEVHADQHAIIFMPGNSNTIYFGNDGGIYLTTNGTSAIPTIVSKSENYNVTQFYACAINPTAYSSQFLAGAQDNGSQQYNSLGINATIEVTGGDGCFNHIDQTQPQYQFTSYVYNNYFRSTDGGVTFNSFVNNNNGSFVNPSDYDDVNNNLYAARSGGSYYVLLNAPVSNTLTTVNVTAFNSGMVTHVSVSPNTAHRVFFGLNNGRIVRVNNANTTSPSATNITGTGMPSGSVSCIAIENGNDNHLLVTYSNYGINSVWETINGGTSWTSVEGNLPDMPVRWALFNPANASQALLATEVGVWSADLLNGNATVWAPSNNGLANVRTDMLQIRSSDKFVIAATHGRGLFSSDVFTTAYADFTSDKRIAYTNKPITFTDGSYKSVSWIWDFGDGTTSTLKNPVKTYSSPGLYNITLQINGSAALQKIKTGFIHILPNKGVPFLIADGGSFDLNSLEFGSESISGTAFERGNSGIAGKNGTRSGSYAWVTGLTASNYANNSDARLWTPNFNMTLPGTYTLKFYRKNSFEIGWDGFRIEYTLDRGDTWISLGTVTASWYDFANNGGATSFPVGQPYFNATRSSYTLAQYDVSFLSGNPSVGFRFRFKSDVSVTAAGLAIEDFELNGPENSPLPVELISFTGKALDNSNELKWITLSEIANDRFEIERSVNGYEFVTVGIIAGKGYSNDPVHYQFNDADIENRNYYYRLRQVDYDGREEFSEIIFIKRDIKSGPLADFVFPNPFTNNFSLFLKHAVREPLKIELFDLRGRSIYTKELIPNGIQVAIDLRELNLSAGSYLLNIYTSKMQQVMKVVKF